MEHLVQRGLVSHCRVVRRQERELRVRVAAFLDDAHEGERSISHREPRHD